MQKEEAMLIKEWLNKDDLTSLTALNDWLENFKLVYGICEMWIIDEADKIPQMTIQSWIERFPKLTTSYELKKLQEHGEHEIILYSLARGYPCSKIEKL